MDRLTTKFHGYNVVEFNQYAENGYSKFTLLQEQMGDKRFITGDAIDLLSAYEDTGLTPDEIRKMQVELQLYKLNPNIRHNQEYLITNTSGDTKMEDI